MGYIQQMLKDNLVLTNFKMVRDKKKKKIKCHTLKHEFMSATKHLSYMFPFLLSKTSGFACNFEF